jgi:hypothetical protein
MQIVQIYFIENFLKIFLNKHLKIYKHAVFKFLFSFKIPALPCYLIFSAGRYFRLKIYLITMSAGCDKKYNADYLNDI